jgi:hypothetical protein
MNATIFRLLLLAAFLAGAAGGRAQPAPAPAPAEKKSAPTHAPAPAPKAKADAASPEAKPAPAAAAPGSVQRLVSEFGTQREGRLDQRKALLDRLRLAKNDEEKQRILAELRQQQQQRLDQQRELARQIREQMQQKRGAASASKPGP